MLESAANLSIPSLRALRGEETTKLKWQFLMYVLSPIKILHLTAPDISLDGNA